MPLGRFAVILTPSPAGQAVPSPARGHTSLGATDGGTQASWRRSDIVVELARRRRLADVVEAWRAVQDPPPDGREPLAETCPAGGSRVYLMVRVSLRPARARSRH